MGMFEISKIPLCFFRWSPSCLGFQVGRMAASTMTPHTSGSHNRAVKPTGVVTSNNAQTRGTVPGGVMGAFVGRTAA